MTVCKTRDVTYFLKLQLARVCFLYAHFFHRNWSDFSQALSKARDTKQINVSEVIIYQKTLSATAATMYLAYFEGVLLFHETYYFDVQPNYFK